MKKKENLAEAFAGLASITQLGLSVAIPIAAFALLASFLKQRYNIPDWLSLVLILVGLAGGINSFVIYIRSYLKRMNKKDDDSNTEV